MKPGAMCSQAYKLAAEQSSEAQPQLHSAQWHCLLPPHGRRQSGERGGRVAEETSMEPGQSQSQSQGALV